ncbi:hypothetical protein GCM10011371_04030 [Novosphingobium marinum]|uniref:Elongation factor P n=1 Tax=Novosphingobium marinum TaxID=1514948 RepID=A0A7Y9XT73_9SPHN|nr:hypothetical protein [Novosphingobium marinum]NYH94094.1 hypothetical protein [Novosphingobium marinum]GGC19552.1 hypothetical protein GCM10011371_04030 [Novosphingobium marinum]
MRKSDIRESRAHSPLPRCWQSRGPGDSRRAIKNGKSLVLALATSLVAAPAAAVPGGTLGTLEKGWYACEAPGDALGPAGDRMPEADFKVVSASSYRAGGTRGTYLLTGDRVVMTSGPFEGRKFHRQSRGFLREIDGSGAPGSIRCILGTRNNRTAD